MAGFAAFQVRRAEYFAPVQLGHKLLAVHNRHFARFEHPDSRCISTWLK